MIKRASFRGALELNMRCVSDQRQGGAKLVKASQSSNKEQRPWTTEMRHNMFLRFHTAASIRRRQGKWRFGATHGASVNHSHRHRTSVF